jgi:5'-3' exonuclease
VKELGENEEIYLVKEHKLLKKQHYRIKSLNEKDELKKITNLPMYNRDKEIYINPGKEYWKERYYEELFSMVEYIAPENYKSLKPYNNEKLKELCMNYIEGLEWILKYYSDGCINNKWHYKYHYPPLFSDLLRYVPDFNMELIEKDIIELEEYTQLCYVLPESSYNLLPEKVENYMKENYKSVKPELVYTYCKYLWESHLDLEEIDIIELNESIKNILIK